VSLSQTRLVANGFEEFTDGTYLWPEGLARYVLNHAARKNQLRNPVMFTA
jgi:hypothetical protein